MKITRVRATPVNLPLEAPYDWTFGALPGFTKAVIEVETDEGITGLGEAPRGELAAMINDSLGPRLVGRDPFDIAGLEARCVPGLRGVQSTTPFPLLRAWGGIETALWDIRGKAWNQPLYQLLGGAVRKDIPFTEYFSFRQALNGKGGEQTPEAVADYCVEMHETHGSTFFEGKFTTADPEPSLEMLRQIRRRLGDKIMLRIDSNKAYSVATARMIAPELEELGVRGWEDPVASFQEMAILRRSTSIPFSVHNCNFQHAVALGTPDIFVTDTATHGGISHAVRFIGACEQMGIDFWFYSGDAGITSALYLHMCAALNWVREPNQSLFTQQVADIIIGGPFKTKNNTVRVPEGPGLGVELDRDRMAHAHKDFVDNGPPNEFHDPANPGVFRRVPLS
ncbi:MAG: mandelate racemase/muconate lactonizing enzyme family protein [Alphaproteobacteria bacterium]